MLQRNDTGYVQQVRAWPTEDHPDHAPFDVGAGEEIDFPVLLAGFAPLDPPADEASDAEPQGDAPAKPARKNAAKAAAQAGDSTEGGEPA